MSLSAQPPAPRLRAVSYERVSTKDQEENALSLAEQRSAAQRYCDSKGWDLVNFYREKGASATNARRPMLQTMAADAELTPRPFDVVVVLNQSRFFRDSYLSETYYRRLEAAGVEFVSATQNYGTGKEANFTRRLIGLVDELASTTNGEQVQSMMIANAASGWWNGSKPPFGYETCFAVRVGKKDKKRLKIDAAEASIVRRIFQLYLFGEPGCRPAGLKAIASKLNHEGVRIRNKPFLTSTISDILHRNAYVGTYYYNMKDSRSGKPRDSSEWVAVPVPPLVSQADFDAVQARLAHNHPKVTAPRTVNSPTLLAGIGTCGHDDCGAGLLLMTGKGGMHRYYTCQKKRTQSAKACGAKARRMADVDGAVLDAIERLILAPGRIEPLLAGLLEQSDEAAAERRADLGRLSAEKTRANAALAAIWETIEAGIASPKDADVADRMTRTRSTIKRCGDEIRLIEDHVSTPSRRITPEVVAKFSETVRSALRGHDFGLRQDYVRLLIDNVVLSASGLTIRGSKKALEHAVGAQRASDGRVLTFAQKWCARLDSNQRPQD